MLHKIASDRRRFKHRLSLLRWGSHAWSKLSTSASFFSSSNVFRQANFEQLVKTSSIQNVECKRWFCAERRALSSTPPMNAFLASESSLCNLSTANCTANRRASLLDDSNIIRKHFVLSRCNSFKTISAPLTV